MDADCGERRGSNSNWKQAATAGHAETGVEKKSAVMIGAPNAH
jgi:hypothetical protein